jgi:hypothetical protein
VSDTEGTGSGEGSDGSSTPEFDAPDVLRRPRGDRRHEAPEVVVPETDDVDEGPPTEAMSVQDLSDDEHGATDDGPPTEAMSLKDIADVDDDDGPSTEAMSIADIRAAKAVKEPLTEVFPRGGPVPPAAPDTDRAADGSAIDSLFRDDKFQEHVDPSILPPIPLPRSGAERRSARDTARAPLTHQQKIMLWTAGGLILVLFLIAIYLLSFRVGEQTTMRDAAESTPTATSEPAMPVDAVGPVEPGEHNWDELLGGECIEPFESVWDAEFTVVECEDEHTAQMLVRAELETQTAFPGVEPLAAQITALCSTPAVLNFDAAGVVSDIELAASFPADSVEWDSGNRTYYCFVTRTSGEPLPGDLSVAA